MEREKLESMLIDFIDGKLIESDRIIIERELTQNEEAYRMYEQLREVMQVMDKSEKLEPGNRLKNTFDKVLQEEIAKASADRSKTIFFQPAIYRVAAGLVLIMGVVAIGYLINRDQQHKAEVLALQKEVEATRQMMLTTMSNPNSASQRIQAVNVALGIEKADDEVVKALAKAMNEDPNTNVRLAAMEALGKFHAEPSVRKILVSALSEQKDPVVQIALIQLLVRIKEKGAIKDLEKIADDANSIDAVKDEAYSGLLKLS